MVICDKCGTENPLGRLFCGSCGARLDLSRMNSETVAESLKRSRFPHLFAKLLKVLLILLAGCVLLAVWPRTTPLGKAGTRLGGQRVISALNAMARTSGGRTLGRDFSEEDVNGYFEHFKSEKMAGKAVSVRLLPGYFRVRIVQPLTTVKTSRFRLEPKASYELLCAPVGGTVRVLSASLGHLKCVGPMKTQVARRVHRLFAAEPEWATLARAEEIRAEEGKIWLNVRKD
jgi:hypothetical protein